MNKILPHIIPAFLMVALFVAFFAFFKYADLEPAHEVVTVDCVPQERWIIINDGQEPHRAFKCGYIRQLVTK